jgi:hypothetical protein
MIDPAGYWPSSLDQPGEAGIDRQHFLTEVKKHSESGGAGVTITLRDGSKLDITPPFLFDQKEIECCIHRGSRLTFVRIAFEKIVYVSTQKDAGPRDALVSRR